MTPPINIDGSDITGATIDGTDVQEVTVDGTQVFSAMPDFLVTQYRFEGDLTDAAGNNDATNSGTTFTSTARKGSQALNVDNDGDFVVSSSTVDLAANNNTDEVSVGGFIYIPSGSADGPFWGPFWTADANNYVGIIRNNGNYAAILTVGGTQASATSSVAEKTDTWVHCMAVVDGSEVGIIIDGTLDTTSSHSLTPSNIGPASLKVGSGDEGINGGVHYQDNSSFADKRLSESEVAELL